MKNTIQKKRQGGLRGLLWMYCGAIVLSVFHAPAYSQALQGYVVADRIGGTPLQGAALSLNQYQAGTSAADGSFVFPDCVSPCAASDRLSVRLSGRGVVNDVLLDNPLDPQFRGQPLMLVMASSSDLTNSRTTYFTQQLAAIHSVPKKPAPVAHPESLAANSHTLSAQEQSGIAATSAMNAEKRFNAVEATWVLLATQEPPDQMLPLYRSGLGTWWRLDADRALSVLSLDALRAQVQTRIGQSEGLAQAWMLRAVLQSAKGDLGGAMNTMDAATKALPTVADVWHFIGLLFLAQPDMAYDNEALEALKLAAQLRSHAGKVPPSVLAASLHDSLGELLEGLQQFDDASQHWAIAYKLYADLRPQGRAHFTDLASRAALNTARMQARLKQPAPALQTLADALVWRRELAEWEPSLTRQYDVATALLNRQQVQEKLLMQCDAEDSQREARQILTELAQLDPLRFQSRLNKVMRATRSPPPGVHKDCSGKQVVWMMDSVVKPVLPTRQAMADIPALRWEYSVTRWRDQSNAVMAMDAPNSAALAAEWTLRVLGIQLRQNDATEGQFSLEVAKTLARLGSLRQMAGQPELALRTYQQAIEFWGSTKLSESPYPWAADIMATLAERIQQLSMAPASRFP